MYYATPEFGIDDSPVRPKFTKKPEKAVKSHNAGFEIRSRRIMRPQRAGLMAKLEQSLKQFDNSITRLNEILQDDKDEK